MIKLITNTVFIFFIGNPFQAQLNIDSSLVFKYNEIVTTATNTKEPTITKRYFCEYIPANYELNYFKKINAQYSLIEFHSKAGNSLIQSKYYLLSKNKLLFFKNNVQEIGYPSKDSIEISEEIKDFSPDSICKSRISIIPNILNFKEENKLYSDCDESSFDQEFFELLKKIIFKSEKIDVLCFDE